MAGFPTKDEILEFVRNSPARVGKREIARAFKIKGDQRSTLKALLRELQDEGLFPINREKSPADSKLPHVLPLEVVDRDTDGELICRPIEKRYSGINARIYLSSRAGSKTRERQAAGIGDRVLARLKQLDDQTYDALVLKELGQSAHTILGIFQSDNEGKSGKIEPVDRRTRYAVHVSRADRKGAETGDLVAATLVPGRHSGPKRGRIHEILGRIDDHRSISLIALFSHGIPIEFEKTHLDQAAKARNPTLENRSDLRDLPLVTIDPKTARDFDDAVHAMPDTDPTNSGGWIIHVAIADVAFHVPPNSALDVEARRRGNSCYFPDRVVPMLPEKLSNDLCSLRPGEERACLAARMQFDRNGRKLSHKFVRGIMKSAARLTYEQVEAARHGRTDQATESLVEPVLSPLWKAYGSLSRARDRRAPLDLNLREREISLSSDGHVEHIGWKTNLEAHRLIEEFMIQANVSAAETLAEHKLPTIYRIHEAPPDDKLLSFKEFMASIDYNFALGQTIKPEQFNRLLTLTAGTDFQDLVAELVLRTQSQAAYSTNNVGHFGLNLRRYAHFTSPIRRYADLTVHRGLIRALNLGSDGLTDEEIEHLAETAEQVSGLERRAVAAERDSTDRYLAAYLENEIGAVFSGRISGVTRFGLFVQLSDTGADGFVPMRTLDSDRYRHDAASHALVGTHNRGIFRLGQSVKVRLEEAAPISGALRFTMLSDPESGRPAKGRKRASPSKPQKSRRARKRTRSRK